MEYFQGILFLTTSRVGQFNEAFMSRIYVSIGYALLDDNATENIWGNLFNNLREDYVRNRGLEITYSYMAKKYVKTLSTDVKELKWKGREIRNGERT